MILIAESGSTKCDWVLLDRHGERKRLFRTMGFNPYFHCEKEIFSYMEKSDEFASLPEDIQHVFFYGAGCSSNSLKAIVSRALQQYFSNAHVAVDHDLVAAAYSTWTGEPAITCILGTGSNSCYFDGKSVSEEVPALAYVLGDEGSGSYYGKQLLSNFLYKRLPEHIAADFYREYGLNKDQIIDQVYNKPHANVYLAGFAVYVAKHKDDPYFQEMVRKGMRKFMQIHVACFPNYREVPVHFVGSLAFIFESTLQEEAAKLGIRVGELIKRPIDGLEKYHREIMIPQLQ